MVFSSYKFVLIFLPIAFLGFTLFSQTKKNVLCKLWLIASSIVFYALGNVRFVPYFLATIIFNYFVGLLIIKLKRKSAKLLVLLAGLGENLLLLGYFKYYNFFISNVNTILSSDFTLKTIILPLGISFFTFQIISYIIECYKGDAPRYTPVDYLFYITFFPYLIMGPLVKHDQVLEQTNDDTFITFDKYNFCLAMFMFSIGCAKKLVLAEPLITYAREFYGVVQPAGFFASWTAVLAYTFAYYFDFSGYGDMAVALGLVFNIKLPMNFNSPYKARNFNDFWQRWNITLSNFLNEYIFRSVYKFGDKVLKMMLAVMVTFLVSGVWHGSGWHFILWGIANGIFVSISSLMALYNKKLPYFVAWAITFSGVLFTRVLFDSANTKQALYVYKALTQFGEYIHLVEFAKNNVYTIGLIVISVGVAFFTKNSGQMMESFKPTAKTAAITAALMALSFLLMSNVSGFLYFQF